jgi:hypothetical protein
MARAQKRVDARIAESGYLLGVVFVGFVAFCFGIAVGVVL